MIRTFLFGWLVYFLIAGVLLFAWPQDISAKYLAAAADKNYRSDQTGPDRVVLLDEPQKSGLARLQIIDQARKSLSVAYYSISNGESANLFFAALFAAADRGVEVKLLLDGICHGLKGENKLVLAAFQLHPNIQVRFYEPFNPLLPWTLNNRLHDKLIIADAELAIIGGRNIADKYFAPQGYKKSITNDRDIIVIKTRPAAKTSALDQMASYFAQLWQHEYSQPVRRPLTRSRRRQARGKCADLQEELQQFQAKHAPFDLVSASLPTNQVSFIHNPITRLSKEPWCWYELTRLIKEARDQVLIQSPYVIPSRTMLAGYLTSSDLVDLDLVILTNSMASTPNPLAYAGYLNHRGKMIDQGIRIYEYQAKDSLHTKAFVFDDDLLAIGTFNLDPRSARLSTESLVLVHSQPAVAKLAQGLQVYIDQSLAVAEDYSYEPAIEPSPAPVSKYKEILLEALARLVRWYEYLL